MIEPVSGLLLIDKPIGISSFDIIRALRRQTNIKKIGHAGTLDPLATGLMLLLFNKATKQAMSLTKADKTYEAEITLGKNSSTGDAEGELTEVSDRQPTRSEIDEVIKGFIGEITQTPSQYSAIKINGTEAYKLARAGKLVEMPSRQVTIHSLEIMSYDYPKLRIRTHVSSGTYIRSLAADLGVQLRVGGYLSSLRRTVVGDYNVTDAVQLADVTAENLEGSLISVN
jgi:tRNA pseudouridine55 synthase